MSFFATFIEKLVKDIADILNDYGLNFLKIKNASNDEVKFQSKRLTKGDNTDTKNQKIPMIILTLSLVRHVIVP